MALIIVDDRERAVTSFLPAQSEIFHINYKIQHINVGDYAIVYEGFIMVIIERKTWTDLAASMLDGRKENVNKLLKLRELTGCKIMYLIEGEPIPRPDKKYGRIPASRLRSHLDHLILRDGIFIINSRDQEDTARRLFELVKNYSTIKPSPFKFAKDKEESEKNIEVLVSEVKEAKENDGEVKEDEQIKEIKPEKSEKEESKSTERSEVSVAKRNDDERNDGEAKRNDNLLQSMPGMLVTETSQQEQFLKCLPCVGSIVSVVLATAGVTIKKIALKEVAPEFIAGLKYDTGACIGLVKAQKICNCATTIASISQNAKKLCAKTVQKVKGISKKTAEIIGNTYTLLDLIQKKITAEELANISKGKVKLGSKIANDLLNKLSV